MLNDLSLSPPLHNYFDYLINIYKYVHMYRYVKLWMNSGETCTLCGVGEHKYWLGGVDVMCDMCV